MKTLRVSSRLRPARPQRRLCAQANMSRMPPSSASARLICKHGALEIAGERDGSAEQGDRITFEISTAPAC
jgi:hypothetical protein